MCESPHFTTYYYFFVFRIYKPNRNTSNQPKKTFKYSQKTEKHFQKNKKSIFRVFMLLTLNYPYMRALSPLKSAVLTLLPAKCVYVWRSRPERRALKPTLRTTLRLTFTHLYGQWSTVTAVVTRVHCVETKTHTLYSCMNIFSLFSYSHQSIIFTWWLMTVILLFFKYFVCHVFILSPHRRT